MLFFIFFKTRPFTGYLQNPSIIPKKLLHQLWEGVEQRNLSWSVKLEIETLTNFINDSTHLKMKYRRRGKTLFKYKLNCNKLDMEDWGLMVMVLSPNSTYS